MGLSQNRGILNMVVSLDFPAINASFEGPLLRYKQTQCCKGFGQLDKWNIRRGPTAVSRFVLFTSEGILSPSRYSLGAVATGVWSLQQYPLA